MKGAKEKALSGLDTEQGTGQISPQDIVSVLIVAREKGKGND